MKSKLAAIAAACSLLLVLACQKAQPPGFVKYKNEGDVPRVSVQDAKVEIDAGTAIMVDARPESAYKEEHVTGSINIPLGTPPDKIKDEIASAQGKKIFVYCSWPNEHTSASLAFQMNENGIPGTYALLGGTVGWKNAGMPIEKSANPATQPANQ